MKIHYICTGEGQPIVLLHGWGASIQVYSSVINLLQNAYKVIAFEMPGVGESDEPSEAWDVNRYTDFTIKFLKNFDLDNVILMGHSFGCRVIVKLLSKERLPFTVDKIIIVDGAGVKPTPNLRRKIRTRIFKMGKSFCNAPVVKKFAPEALSHLQAFFGSSDYANASPIMRETLVKVVNEDLTGLFPNVIPETLLIWGQNDTATPLSDGQLMEQMMPNAGLAVIKNAGHFSFLDQPIIFSKILSSYLHLE